MLEREDFTGKPNLKVFEFSHCGHQFKVSNWYDLKVVEGAAKVEQDGLLLSFDDGMSHDMRKPIFDLAVTMDQEKHQFEVFAFGLVSPQIQCRVDGTVVYGPEKIPAYVSLLGPINLYGQRLAEKSSKKREVTDSQQGRAYKLGRALRLVIIFLVFFFGTGWVLDFFGL